MKNEELFSLLRSFGLFFLAFVLLHRFFLLNLHDFN